MIIWTPLTLLSLFFQFYLAEQSKVFPIRSDSPIGWVVFDLLFEKLCSIQEKLEVLKRPGSEINGLFTISDDDPFTVVSNASLRRWDMPESRQLYLIEIVANQSLDYERVIILQIEIQPAFFVDGPRFSSSEYFSTVNNMGSIGLTFSESKASIGEGDTKSLTFWMPKPTGRKSNTDKIPNVEFALTTRTIASESIRLESYRENNTYYIQVFLQLPIQRKIRKLIVYIGAIDRETNRRLATTRVQIQIVRSPAPTFDNEKIVLNLEEPLQLTMNKNLVRVAAKTNNGIPMYRIEPESAPFDVAPIYGDVFARHTLPPGTYSFTVVATDALGEEGKCDIEVNVLRNNVPNSQLQTNTSEIHMLDWRLKGSLDPKDKDQRRQFSNRDGGKTRWTRKLKDKNEDLLIILLETRKPGLLDEKIPLYPSERVFSLKSTSSNHIRIYENGTLELVKALNYEIESSFSISLEIAGPLRMRLLMLTIEVTDVDEPPEILNHWPFLAVISPAGQLIGQDVYRIEARDELGLGSDNLTYHLINSEPPGTFIVDRYTGIVRTMSKKYVAGQVYRVFVEVRDYPSPEQAKQDKKELTIAMVEILAGDRPPQFLQQKYIVSLPENLEVGASVIKLDVHQFPSISGRRKRPVIYSLFAPHEDDYSDHFGIYEQTGLVFLRKRLDYDDLLQPKKIIIYGLAKEEGRESTVPIEIEISDINDNPPLFAQPIYTTSVYEDISSHTPILTIRAMDADGPGPNSAILYSVDHPQFTINQEGEIFRLEDASPLDADQTGQGFYIYRFNATATDQGDPALQSSTKIHIRAENVNDETPIFIPGSEYVAIIAEDAQGNTPVLQVHAIDIDRDQIYYSFAIDENGSESQITESFEIDHITGLIRLRSHVTPQDLLELSAINLTVIARDDGEPTRGHHIQAVVRVEIADVNNNKPEFVDCAEYSRKARIEEGQYKGPETPVIVQAHAKDEDAGPNGNVTYSIYYPRLEQRKPFVIDANTGEIRPSPYFIFDREQKASEEVTIKATDKGEKPLIGFCQFTVEILDVNDNSPQFDRPLYETSMARITPPGTRVLTVFADDRDSPTNAKITYVLSTDETAPEGHKEDWKFFELPNPELGEIALSRRVPRSKDRFFFSVIASDNGWPEAHTAVIQTIIRVHNRHQNAPQWQSNSPECLQQIAIPEDIQKNTMILKCYAISAEDRTRPISYKLSNSAGNFDKNNKQTFREFVEKEDSGLSYVVVRNMESLDYEQVRNYTLTLTATDMISSATSERQFEILISDRNDEVPRFTVDRFIGAIDEEQTPAEYADRVGQPITVVHAEDSDSFGKQNEVRYKILDGLDLAASKYFRIDEVSGEIYPLATFDRELNDSFIFDVEARDSMPSSLPGTRPGEPNKDIVKVQIFVSDVNDNPPLFGANTYEFNVSESTEIGKELITVRATDLDSHSNLRYYLYSPDVRTLKIPFGVKIDSGIIYVKDVLDYESVSTYHLELMATDGKYNATTHLRVFIGDINDNPPVFEQRFYEAVVVEENASELPKMLFVAHATDIDTNETNGKIVYLLDGQGIGEYFRIDRYSGIVELISPLDRDPPNGKPEWRFIVQAIDQNGYGLVGYCYVHIVVQDVNDNAPIFGSLSLIGEVEENREPETYIISVKANDFDDPNTPNAQLEYSIMFNKEVEGQSLFRIDPISGKIFAMVKFDRELPSLYKIEVRATDHGKPQREGQTNVTIRVRDVNDNPPLFDHADHFILIPENIPPHTPVLSLAAHDNDNEAKNNEFTYELVDQPNDFFYVTTVANDEGPRIGVLRLKKQLNYEDPVQRLNGFQLQIQVFDGKYYGNTKVYARVEDVNDCNPELHGPTQLHNIREDSQLDTILAHYTITDDDVGDKYFE